MKRAILVALFATLFINVAFAATPTAAPTLPKDLKTAWKKVYTDSCRRPGGIIVSTVYVKRGVSDKLGPITRNGKLVALFSLTERVALIIVKQADGGWLSYDWATERDKGVTAIEKIIAMTEKKFAECLAEKK